VVFILIGLGVVSVDVAMVYPLYKARLKTLSRCCSRLRRYKITLSPLKEVHLDPCQSTTPTGAFFCVLDWPCAAPRNPQHSAPKSLIT